MNRSGVTDHHLPEDCATIESAEVTLYYDGNDLFEIYREPDDWYEAMVVLMAGRAPA